MNPKELVQAEWPKSVRHWDRERRVSREQRGGLTKNSGTATDFQICSLEMTEEKEKSGRIRGEKVNMIKMTMRGWRIILKLVGYINLLNCKHKTFMEKKNNCQYRIQLSSPFHDIDNN